MTALDVANLPDYTHGDMFGNIGGFSIAMGLAGFRTAWYMDNHPFASFLHARQYPSCVHFGNIFDYDTLPYVDVITAGFPCQPFSHAGKRLGRKDPRYLVPKMLEIMMEVRPRAILFENTPGFPTLNNGAEFRYLLRTLAQNGYDAEWDHLRACDFGAPHIRERWFCVAYTSSNRRPESGTIQNATPDAQRHVSPHKRGGRTERYEIVPGGENVGNGNGQYPKRNGAEWQQIAPVGHRTWQLERPGSQFDQYRPAQPRLGRGIDGVSDWLDGLRWPAPQGVAQYDWEPSRTVAGIPNRGARVERLGLAIVPQVIYPTCCAIWDWLEEQDRAEEN